MMGFVVADQADSLYAYMANEVSSMVKKGSFEGILAKVETQVGKYKGHGEWEVQTVMGQKA